MHFWRIARWTLVAIGSPSGLHATQGIAAAERGLHVLTEKPIDISTSAQTPSSRRRERSGVKLGVMFQDRVKPGIRQLKEWISTGVIGKPHVGGCAREVVPAPRVLQPVAMAWNAGAGWWRSVDQSGDPHCRSAALASGRCGSRAVTDRDRAA